MAETKIKVTKVETFNAIAKALEEKGITTLSIKGIDVDAVAFCNHEVELIQNKASKSASKKVDNSIYFESVENALSTGAKTPTELVALVDGVENTQKIASIVGAMPNVTKVVKGKKVTYELV